MKRRQAVIWVVLTALLVGGAFARWQAAERLPRWAYRGKESAVAWAVRLGVPTDHADFNGRRPLHLAAQQGHLRIVEVLMRAGANLEAEDRQGRSPLYWAVWSGNADVVRALLDGGANYDGGKRGSASTLSVAARRGNVEITEILLEYGADPNRPVGRFATSALHTAAWEGHADVVQMLLQHGGDPMLKNQRGISALMYAEMRADPETLEVMCRHLYPEYSADDLEAYLLTRVCQAGRMRDVKRMLDAGADVNCHDEFGMTPLHMVGLRPHEEVVRFLLDRGANPRVANLQQETPLHLAATSNDPDSVQLLLQAGADVNARDAQGRTPLERAVRQSACTSDLNRVVTLLVEWGADVRQPAANGTPLADIAETRRCQRLHLTLLALQNGPPETQTAETQVLPLTPEQRAAALQRLEQQLREKLGYE